MKRFIFGSMTLGLLLTTMPVHAQTVQTPSTKVPKYGGGPSSDPIGTTSGTTVKGSPQDANNRMTDSRGSINERNLPYYKTHGRGGQYLGLRP
jgi:hypothetical protein